MELKVTTTPNDLDVFAEIFGDIHIAVYRDSATSTKEIVSALVNAEERAARVVSLEDDKRELVNRLRLLAAFLTGMSDQAKDDGRDHAHSILSGTVKQIYILLREHGVDQ